MPRAPRAIVGTSRDGRYDMRGTVCYRAEEDARLEKWNSGLDFVQIVEIHRAEGRPPPGESKKREPKRKRDVESVPRSGSETAGTTESESLADDAHDLDKFELGKGLPDPDELSDLGDLVAAESVNGRVSNKQRVSSQ